MSKDTKCLLVPTGPVGIKLGKTHEEDIILFLNRSEAEEELKPKQPASVMLRVDKDSYRAGNKIVPIVVSYKFNSTIFHRNLSIKATLKQMKKTNNIECRVEPKQFKFIKHQLINFLKKLVMFICQIINNKNWIEKDLQQADIEREMTFREFAIFPTRDHVVIIRKTKQGKKQTLKSISFLISFEKCAFLVMRGEHLVQEDDFNKTLINFLGIDESQSFLVKQSLGYDIAELENQMENDERITHLLSSTSLEATKLDDKEKAGLLSIIELGLEAEDDNLAENSEFPEEVQEALLQIASAVQQLNSNTGSKTYLHSSSITPSTLGISGTTGASIALSAPAGSVNTGVQWEPDQRSVEVRSEVSKMDWIKRGIFKTMFKIIMVCSKLQFPLKKYDLPLDICKHLLLNNPVGCRVFHTTFWKMIGQLESYDVDSYSGLIYALTRLMRVNPLPMIFVKDSGVSKLLGMYVNLSWCFTGSKAYNNLSHTMISSSPTTQQLVTSGNTSTSGQQVGAWIGSSKKELPKFSKVFEQTPKKVDYASPSTTRTSRGPMMRNSPSMITLVSPSPVHDNSSNTASTSSALSSRSTGVDLANGSVTINSPSAEDSKRNSFQKRRTTSSPTVVKSKISKKSTSPNTSNASINIPVKSSNTTVRVVSNKGEPSNVYRSASMKHDSAKEDDDKAESEDKMRLSRPKSKVDDDDESEITDSSEDVDESDDDDDDDEDTESPQSKKDSSSPIDSSESTPILLSKSASASSNSLASPATPLNKPNVPKLPSLVPTLNFSNSPVGETNAVNSTAKKVSPRRTTLPKLNLGSPNPMNPTTPHLSLPMSIISPKGESARPGHITPKRTASPLLQLSFRQSSLNEFKDLAKKIGETYISADLTTLLSFKNETDRNKKDKSSRQGLGAAQKSTYLGASNTDEETEEPVSSAKRKITKNNDELTFRSHQHPHFVVKCDILNILGVLSEIPNFKRVIRNPINLFYTELMLSRRTEYVNDFNDRFRSYLLPVLQNIAEQVEIDQRLCWTSKTEGMVDDSKKSYRRKMDVLLWRLRSRLQSACEMEDLKEVSIQLRVLGDYLSSCKTRIMSVQCADVCLPILLKIKYYVMQEKPSTKFPELIDIWHCLLRVFDLIAQQNLFAPLNDFLLTILYHKNETFDYIESYSNSILTNTTWESKLISLHSEKYLEELRLQVMEHFSVCVDMISKQYQTLQTNVTKELIEKLEFLIFPSTGIIQRLLGSDKSSFALKSSMLTFLHKLLWLRDKNSPMLSDNYIDSYISFHYLHFLRLYHNYSIEKETLELCQKHLRILTDFAMQKTEKVMLKFYQLKVMDFMSREISLEYEVTIMYKNYMDDLQRKKLDEQKNEEQKKLIKAAAPPPASKGAPEKGKISLGGGGGLKLDLTTVPKKGELAGSIAAAASQQIDNTETSESSSSSSSSSDSSSESDSSDSGSGKSSSKSGSSSSSNSDSSSESGDDSSTDDKKEPSVPQITATAGLNIKITGLEPDRIIHVPGNTTAPASTPAPAPAPKVTLSKGALALKLPSDAIKGGPNPTGAKEESSSESGSEDSGSGSGSGSGTKSSKSGSDSDDDGTGTKSSDDSSEESEEKPSKPVLSMASLSLKLPSDAIKGGKTETNTKPTEESGGSKSEEEEEDDSKSGSRSRSSSGSESGSDASSKSSGSGGDSSSESSAEEKVVKKPTLGLKLTSDMIKGGSKDTNTTTTNTEDKPKPALGLKLPTTAIKGGDAPKPTETVNNESKPAAGKPTLGLKLPPSAVKGAPPQEKNDKGAKPGGFGLKLTPELIKGQQPEKKKGESSSANSTSSNASSTNTKAGGGGFLSKMEKAIANQSHEPAKFQDLLAAAQKTVPEVEQTDKEGELQMYLKERLNRKLYSDDKLHLEFLDLIFVLLLSPNGFTLEPLYTNQFPMRILKMNIPFVLRLHVNHPTNSSLLGRLANKLQAINPSAFRMLKLISTRFFQPSLLTDLVQFAEGAYGRVYGCKLLGENVAVKQMDVPPSIHDRCVPHDIFTEITILDKWRADERICQLIDYGVDEHHFWIVMRRYATSLKDWRNKQSKSLEENLLLYLNVYDYVLNTSRFLEENNVNHYDIKLDNYLIEPLKEGLTKEDLYNQESSTPNFSVCLADFGESHVFMREKGENAYTTDNRGTEFIKSPEMLTIAYAKQVERESYDRRKHAGAGAPSDIWSLGCLFFELLTGDFLFYDVDWVRFFLRVTSDEELITEERATMLNNSNDLMNFLKSILIREPNYRPKIMDVKNRLKILKQKVKDEEKRKKDEAKRNETTTTTVINITNEEENSIQPKSFESIESTPEKSSSTLSQSNPPQSSTVASQSSDSTSKSSSNTPSSTKRGKLTKSMTSKEETTTDDSASPISSRKGSTSNNNNNLSPEEADLSVSPIKIDPKNPFGSIKAKSAVRKLSVRSLTKSFTARDDTKEIKREKTRSSEFDSPLTNTASGSATTRAASSKKAQTPPKKKYNPKEAEESFKLLKQKREEEQEKAVQQIQYVPLKFDTTELKYFQDCPTEITSYLYLGFFSCVQNNKNNLISKYGITHIVNCTEKANLFSEHFQYHNPPSDNFKSIIEPFLDFVKTAGISRGKVLVVSDDTTNNVNRSLALSGGTNASSNTSTSSVISAATAPTLVIAFLMTNRSLSFFEAFQFVQKLRYVITLDARSIQQLIRYEKKELKEKKDKNREYFKCICGHNSWGLLKPLDKTDHQNPISCNCQLDDLKDCPTYGCGRFCEEIAERSNYAWKAQSIKWGFTIKDNVNSNFEGCEEYTPFLEYNVDVENQLDPKPWTVYRCRRCKFLCYAENTQNTQNIAIVTNIRIENKSTNATTQTSDQKSDIKK
eukprot:TRINITY_DN124_c7_g1_i1.p1 TRINITY_DN124_c7_g1~~TRINITY_DN124_c7_g1_i1.p1  ORF type:complete len:2853 (+),score=800.21 TRINITY_DN124_c7_g1_i1:78-8636(+)